MKENLKLWDAVRAVPREAMRDFNNGKFRGTDINATWRLRTLTEHFGMCGFGWYYTIDKQWTEMYNEEVKVFCNISLYVKVDGEWSMPIQATGGNSFAKKWSNKVDVSDECYKMALTDAIGVACHRLGFGADVYWAHEDSKYTQSNPAPFDDLFAKAYEALAKAKTTAEIKAIYEQQYTSLIPTKNEQDTDKTRWRDAVIARNIEINQ